MPRTGNSIDCSIGDREAGRILTRELEISSGESSCTDPIGESEQGRGIF